MSARSLLPLLPLACLLALGCESASAVRGYTSCGDFGGDPVECQPGQYCYDVLYSECEPGCTSDVNCADSQTCIKAAGESVGDCQNTASPPPPTGSDAGAPPPPPPGSDAGPPPPPPSRAAECRQSCQDAAFFCDDGSITPSVVAACDTWCGDSLTDDTERGAFIACIEAAFFSDLVCAEEDCLP